MKYDNKKRDFFNSAIKFFQRTNKHELLKKSVIKLIVIKLIVIKPLLKTENN